MEKTTQYKGIFYKNKTSHKFYEGGAHFSYKVLIKKLYKLKDELGKERFVPDSFSQFEEKDSKERIEIRKINIPLLRHKNKSMNYLINNDNEKKEKNETVYTKINEQMQKVTNINNKIRIISKGKNIDNSNNIKRLNKIDNFFNNSIYNNKNSLNIPIIYNQKNKSEGKADNNNLRKNGYLEPIKKKCNNNIKMSSTIGFNENNKYYNYYMNYYNDSLLKNKASRNKKQYNNNSVSQSLNKYTNNTRLLDKFSLINNYNKNKNFAYFSKNMKIYNANSIDYNINKNKLNNTKINFNNKRGKNGRIIINADKSKERMNMSIINFYNMKNNNKY